MNRTQYRAARKLVRQNGAYAMRWLDASAQRAVDWLVYPKIDHLAERADIVAYCKREGVTCNVRQTA